MRLLAILGVFAVTTSLGQITIGTINNQSNAHDGYTLFGPLNDSTTFLIDNCGRVVHQWVHDERAGNSVYILDNGDLLRCAESADTVNFTSGGFGGAIEMYDWNGNLTWYYEYSTNQVRHHHDAHILPNGNVLILAWERKTKMQALLAGRDTSNMDDESLWPEHLIEVQPTGDSTGTIVWEWHMWDHLIQDFDPTKLNYGVVEDNPQLIDINYHKNNRDDWIHANGIDYNPQLDQIILSAKNNSEIWVIDHSTTTAEASGSTGGNAGMGGDLIYRWGNPEAYGRGDSTDKKLFDQHHPTWIPQGSPHAGKILVFNNGPNRGFSTVEYFTPPLNGYNYDTLANGQFGPDTVDYMYQDPTDSTNFHAPFISGAQMLPNGNILACAGPTGYFFEVDSSTNTKLWEYINPMGLAPFTQGDTVIIGNYVFRATRYTADHPGLAGKDLTPGGYIELDPDTNFCQVYTGIAEENGVNEIRIYPNPSEGILNLDMDGEYSGELNATFVALDGRIVRQTRVQNLQINAGDLAPGMYLVHIIGSETKAIARVVIR